MPLVNMFLLISPSICRR